MVIIAWVAMMILPCAPTSTASETLTAFQRSSKEEFGGVVPSSWPRDARRSFAPDPADTGRFDTHKPIHLVPACKEAASRSLLYLDSTTVDAGSHGATAIANSQAVGAGPGIKVMDRQKVPWRVPKVLFGVPGLEDVANRMAKETPDCGGNTPLHEAVYSRRIDQIRALLATGANPNTRDWRRGRGRGQTPLHGAVFGPAIKVASTLAAAGADIDGEDIRGRTPLYRAAALPIFGRRAYRNRCIMLLKLLLVAGADVNQRAPGGRSVLHRAVSNCGYRVRSKIRLLLDAGADIEAKDLGGGTPLHHACSLFSPSGVKALLEEGADVHARTDSEHTPLTIALRHYQGMHRESFLARQKEVVKILLAAGADVNGRAGPQGSTPLEIVVRDGNKELAELLKEHGAKE